MGATGEKLKPTGEKSKPSGEKNRRAGERVGRNISPQPKPLQHKALRAFFYSWGDGEEIFHPF